MHTYQKAWKSSFDFLVRYVKGNDAMVNSVDLDQMASSGLVISGSMLFSLASMSKW